MAPTLYAARGGNAASNLYRFNLTTGVETTIGPTGIAITGLAIHPTSGVCYAVTTPNSPGGTNQRLYTISLTSGHATFVGSLGHTVPDIAFDAAGVLYGWSTGAKKLCTINLSTGAATPFGSAVPSISGGGIAVRSDGVAFTAFDSSFPQNLETIDLTTAVPSVVAAISGYNPGASNSAAFAFDESDVLWAIGSGANVRVYTIDTTTAVATVKFTIDLPTLSQYDALVWGPGPDPPTCPSDAWGANGDNTNQPVYCIDKTTTLTTNLGANVGFGVTGLAIDPTDSTLYGVTSGNSVAHPRSLISVDPVTGVGTFIGSEGLSSPVSDIAFTSDGTLYGWSNTFPASVGTINKTTGVFTTLGPPGGGISGPGAVAVNSSDVLYAIIASGYQAIYTVNKSDGSFTLVANYTPLGAFDVVSAAAFDAANVLYTVVNTFTGGSTENLGWRLRTLSLAGTFVDVGSLPNQADALAIITETPPPPVVVVRPPGDLPWRFSVGTVPMGT